MTTTQPLARPQVWLGIGWVLVLGVVVLSLIPLALPKTRVEDLDKIEHLLAYLAMMWWFAALSTTRRHLVIGLALCALGGAVEIAQSLIGWRAGEWYDFAADAVGVLFGWGLARLTGARPFIWLEQRLGLRPAA